jgi:hypothetical protein
VQVPLRFINNAILELALLIMRYHFFLRRKYCISYNNKEVEILGSSFSFVDTLLSLRAFSLITEPLLILEVYLQKLRSDNQQTFLGERQAS